MIGNFDGRADWRDRSELGCVKPRSLWGIHDETHAPCALECDFVRNL